MLNDMTKHTDIDGNADVTKGHRSDDPNTRLTELEIQLQELRKQLALARGTENNVQTREPREVRKADLASRIEQALRTNIYTTEDLAKVLGEPVGKVKEKIKALRANIADIGTPDRAEWVWKIGDNTAAKELRDLVAKLIEGRKFTTAQLTSITGARMPRVNGVLVDLQRDPEMKDRIFDLGSKFRAQWMILPEDARPANLPPKGKK